MDKIQYTGLITYLRDINKTLKQLVKISQEPGSTGTPINLQDKVTYTLNCSVCGKVIYRKDAFDTFCDEHSNPEKYITN